MPFWKADNERRWMQTADRLPLPLGLQGDRPRPGGAAVRHRGSHGGERAHRHTVPEQQSRLLPLPERGAVRRERDGPSRPIRTTAPAPGRHHGDVRDFFPPGPFTDGEAHVCPVVFGRIDDLFESLRPSMFSILLSWPDGCAVADGIVGMGHHSFFLLQPGNDLCG